MTNQEILQTAIQKAIDGGWKDIESRERAIDGYKQGGVYGLIFNHDFAKSLFGDEVICGYCGVDCVLDHHYDNKFENWQYHLQQLVISDDVFKYLEEHAL